MKLSRVFLSAFKFLVLLTFVASVALWFFGDQVLEKFRPAIQSQLSTLFDGEVTFTAIRGGLLPRLNVRLENAHVITNRGHSDIRAKAVTLALDLISLVKKQVVIDRVAISDADFVLSTGQSFKIRRTNFPIQIRDELIDIPAVTLDGQLGQQAVGVTSGALQINTSTRALKFSNFLATLGKQSLRINGDFDRFAARSNLQIELREFSLRTAQELSQLFQARLNPSLDGNLTMLVDVKSSESGAWSVSGKLNARQLGIRDAADVYGVGKATGSFSFQSKNSSGLFLTSDLAIEDFSYSDGDTSLEHVNADLKRISINSMQNGDVRATVDLSGQRLSLSNPEIKITRADSVKAPLTIVVSKKEGYSVAGPVTIEQAELETHGLNFSGVTGTVEMLISKPLKRFNSSTLQANSQNRALSIATDFSMTPERYEAKRSTINIGDGAMTVDFALARDAKRAYQAQISAKNLKVSDIVSISQQKDDDSFAGDVGNLSASLAGDFLNPSSSTTGSGELIVNNPLLKDYNLTTAISKAIAEVPFVGTTLSPSGNDDGSQLAAAEASFTIADEKINFSHVTIRRDRYTVNGKGTLGFNRALDVRADVVFLSDTFRSLGLGFETLGSLLARAGKISIPIFISGPISKPAVSLDAQKLLADNSGVTLAESVLKKSIKVGSAVGKAILKPLKVFQPSATPSPEPTLR